MKESLNTFTDKPLINGSCAHRNETQALFKQTRTVCIKLKNPKAYFTAAETKCFYRNVQVEEWDSK